MAHGRLGTAADETLYATGGGISTHQLWGLGGNDILDSRTTQDGRVLSTDDELYGDIIPNGQIQYDPNVIPPGVPGNDTLYGGAGYDKLYGDAGNDILDGGDGDDRLDGGEGFDFADYLSATGGVSVDLYDPSKNSGAASGATGNDTLVNIEGIIGSNFGDTLEGNNSDNTIYGNDGDDFISGVIGNDTLYGDVGNDTLAGDSEDDYLNGGNGNDKLYGGFGNDTLLGMGGNDTLDGGDGNDRLDGYATSGTEYDTLTGGDGSDIFVLGGSWGVFYQGPGRAVITDWNSAYDYIEVLGSANQYELRTGNWVGGDALDTRIYLAGTNDSIAIVQDSTDLLLGPRDFKFV